MPIHIRLILLDRRGYGGSPFTRCSDFDVDAHDIVDLLEHPAHLVGHSYGAVACLVAAAMQPAKILSLTVIEPPAFGLIRGHEPVEQAIEHLKAAYAMSDPLDFYFAFTGHPEGQPRPEMNFSEADIDGIRTAMHQRPAWEAEVKLSRTGGRSVPQAGRLRQAAASAPGEAPAPEHTRHAGRVRPAHGAA